MGTKLNKRGYMQLIEENLDWLNNKCPASLEKDHIRDVLKCSIDLLYPDKNSSITIKAEFICEFETFMKWVNNASYYLGEYKKRDDTIICIDKNGHSCFIGKQFMHARDNDLFPVKAYRLIKNTDNS